MLVRVRASLLIRPRRRIFIVRVVLRSSQLNPVEQSRPTFWVLNHRWWFKPVEPVSQTNQIIAKGSRRSYQKDYPLYQSVLRWSQSSTVQTRQSYPRHRFEFCVQWLLRPCSEHPRTLRLDQAVSHHVQQVQTHNKTWKVHCIIMLQVPITLTNKVHLKPTVITIGHTE